MQIHSSRQTTDIIVTAKSIHMDFVEGNIEEEKEFGGVAFPKTLNPPPAKSGNEQCGASQLITMINEKREELREMLRRHSAVLLRGFDVRTAVEFGQVVEAFGWEEMPYTGPITRLKMEDRVFTTNEAPLHRLINFHHEMALMKEFPSKIIFFCSQPSPEGGQTSILPSHVVVGKMEKRFPEFTTKLSTSGCLSRMMLPKENSENAVVSRTWKALLKTDDPMEAEKRAKEKLGVTAAVFKKDGSAEFVYGPMNPIREFDGKRVWFNTILSNSSEKFAVSFADGSRLPAEVFQGYQEILDEICVDINWQKGDILVLDNLQVQHARRPGKPPRQILVSVCK